MRWVMLLVLLPVRLEAQAREVVVGQTFMATASHDLMNHEGFRLYIDGVFWSEVREPSLCSGVWTFGSMSETLRNGIHVGGGSGFLYRCVDGTVVVFAGDQNGWWWWDETAWRFYGATGPAVATVEVPGMVNTPGPHVLEVATYRAGQEAKSMPVTVMALTEQNLPRPQTPTGARVQ